MAYTKRNYYRRIIDIQNYVLKIKAENPGISTKELYHTYIEPRWHISRRTFSNYMAVNAKRELKALDGEKNNQNQLSLF